MYFIAALMVCGWVYIILIMLTAGIEHYRVMRDSEDEK